MIVILSDIHLEIVLACILPFSSQENSHCYYSSMINNFSITKETSHTILLYKIHQLHALVFLTWVFLMPCIFFCNWIFKCKSFWLLYKKATRKKNLILFLGSAPTYKVIEVLQNVNSLSWTNKFIKLCHTSL